MKLLVLCSALLAAWLCCGSVRGAQECSTYNKDSKIGSCHPNKGFTPNQDYIGKEGDSGCKEVCREKGFIDGCCTGATEGDQHCWCALSRNVVQQAPKRGRPRAQTGL